MKPVTLALVVVSATVVVLLRRRHIEHDLHADARDMEYEAWVRATDNRPPKPSDFAKLRRVYDSSAIRRTIIEIARSNPAQLTLPLLETVLFLRAQALHGEAA